ncbi:hypothetical protein AQ490_25790 [Wenjunlia vitaminophila]|uniref:D-inositol 3-phosphate glycosyltransferase n=1 Tax=Wenjunlia vitaminophila TaxID=76728 RepID=A0A0T6LQ32_WENVI|nr:glycosyltransferase family 4 protein [Wenjunlia vitaminophila]KRV48218.1 hypothetical protein AQ490_25790 [Wenjunlia vitaminophila]
MHVLHVIDSLHDTGGAGHALAVTAPHLVRDGVRLDVACLQPGDTAPLTAAGVDVFAVGHRGRLRAAAALSGLIRRRRPDLVHTTLHQADLVGRAAANAARVPVISSLVRSAYGPEQLARCGRTSLRVRGAQVADALTAVGVRRFQALTRHLATEMSRRLAVDPMLIDVVPQGRDPRVLGTVTESRRAAVRAALGLGRNQPVVLAAARQHHSNGLDVLIRCWPQVRAWEPHAVLLLAGRPDEHTPRLKALGANDPSVVFLGHRKDVYGLMAASDVVVAPSRREGMSSTAMEAMGVGVPLVATDVPALRETVGRDEHALLVPPEDGDALHRGLLDALTYRGAAARRATAAREHFLSHYTLERISQLMIAFYRKALLRTV